MLGLEGSQGGGREEEERVSIDIMFYNNGTATQSTNSPPPNGQVARKREGFIPRVAPHKNLVSLVSSRVLDMLLDGWRAGDVLVKVGSFVLPNRACLLLLFLCGRLVFEDVEGGDKACCRGIQGSRVNKAAFRRFSATARRLPWSSRAPISASSLLARRKIAHSTPHQ